MLSHPVRPTTATGPAPTPLNTHNANMNGHSNSTHGHTRSGNDAETHHLLRDEARFEAERLRREISQNTTELQRLEQLSQQVRQGGYKPSVTPPLVQAVLANGHSASNGGTGLAARLPSQGSLKAPGSAGQRSTSTGKLIEHLQHELGSLKLTAESFRRQFESEKAAREALKVRHDDLEGSLSMARVESRSHALSLARSDKAMQAALEGQKLLAAQLQESEAARKALEQAREADVTAAVALREDLARETAARERSEGAYAVLAQEHAQFQGQSQTQLQALQAQWQELKRNLLGDGQTIKETQSAQEALKQLQARQTQEAVNLDALRQALNEARQEESLALQKTVEGLRADVARLEQEAEMRSSVVMGVEEQWMLLKQKLPRPG